MTEYQLFETQERGADLSDDGLYRYFLWRQWGDAPRMVWIMLNPSTADHMKNDATTTKCIKYAQREGCGGIEIINLYALRTTKPEHLYHHPDPEGRQNSEVWADVLGMAWETDRRIIAGWGAGATAVELVMGAPVALERHLDFLIANAECLGMNRDGSPCHPLYLKDEKAFERWCP